MDLENKYFPIYLSEPVEIVLNPNTGELVLDVFQLLSTNQTVKMRLVLEPAVALKLLSAAPEIQTNFGELIEEKAKQRSVQ